MPFDGSPTVNQVADYLKEMAHYFRVYGFSPTLHEGDCSCFLGASDIITLRRPHNSPVEWLETFQIERAVEAALVPYVGNFGTESLIEQVWTDERAATACELAREDVLAKGINDEC